MIETEPQEQLEFRRPFTQVVKQYITITNKNTLSPIAFKVKTTAPKMYCVRPNSGKLSPGESTQVQVLLQQQTQSADLKCKDKFLIQAIEISSLVMRSEGEEYSTTVYGLWQDAEEKKKADSGFVDEIKLKCVFLPEIEDTVSTLGFKPIVNTVEDVTTHVRKPSIQSPTATVDRKPSVSFLAKSSSAVISPLFSLSEDEVSGLHTTIKRLNERCEGYKLEIERLNALKAKRAEPAAPVPAVVVKEFKSNVDKASSFDVGFRNRPVQLDGIPTQTVALIAFMAFLFGVLFF